MRQLFLVALISSLATASFAQSHDLPSPDASTVYANNPGKVLPLTSGKTELQKEAERVAAYQHAMSLGNQTPVSDLSQTPLDSQSTQAPLAPNGLQPMKLYVTAETASDHTVIKDDTLYNISKRYGVSLSELKRANNIPGSSIQLGQVLVIPVRKQAALQPVSPNVRKIIEPVSIEHDDETQMAAEPEKSTLQIYAVAPADTLSAIARRTCVPAKQLIAANGLTNPDALRPGQRLTLPEGHCLTQ